MNASSKYFITSLLFLLVLFIYIKSPVVSTADTIWSLYVTTSIIKEGNTDLDEFSSLISSDDYRIERVGNHLYSIFPVGTSLLAVPFIWVAERLFPLREHVTFSEYLSQHAPDQTVFEVEKAIASIIMTFTVIMIFLIASKFIHRNRALLVAFIFAFGTSAWSVGSRGLWQHGPSMLVLAVTLYIIVLFKEEPWLLQFAAFPIAFAYIIRPTNIISVLIFSIYVFLVGRPYAIRYSSWLAVLTLPFLLYNYSIYKMLVPAYYLPERLGGNPFFLEALAGNLISPSRGLLIFSPILLFSLRELFMKPGNTDWQMLRLCLIAILISHWISISMFRHWYGGWSIGPRFFADVLPIFAYFLIPAVDRFANLAHKLGLGNCLFWALALLSLFIHFRCATLTAPFNWNSSPVNIDQSTYRLWDWSDIQFLRGLCPKPYYKAPKCWFAHNSEKLETGLGNVETHLRIGDSVSNNLVRIRREEILESADAYLGMP